MLVQKVLQLFDGKFPFAQEHDAAFTAALLTNIRNIVPDFEWQSQAVCDAFAKHVAEAVNALRVAQDAQHVH